MKGDDNMKKVLVFIGTFFLWTGLVGADTFYPTQDATIDNDYPDTNYGSETSIWIYGGDDALFPIRRTFIQFDLSGITTGTTISSATLWLYLITQAGVWNMYFHKVTSSWTENGVTWNAQPSFSADTFAESGYQGSDGTWYSWDLTTLTQDWIDTPAENNGLVIKIEGESTPGTGMGHCYIWCSRDTSNATIRPYLDINLLSVVEENPLLSPNPASISVTPNPISNEPAVISFCLPQNCRVQIKVFNIVGNPVKTVLDEERTPGEHSIRWDNRELANSGVYFVKIEAGDFKRVEKILVIK